jgi:hypothetical protein
VPVERDAPAPAPAVQASAFLGPRSGLRLVF